MTTKASFAALCRAEIENGATPQAAFASVRRKHPEAFLAVLMSNGRMTREQATAFIAQREKAKELAVAGDNRYPNRTRDYDDR